MGAFYTLALALAPKLAHHLAHRAEIDAAKSPSPQDFEAACVHGSRHRALSCHWERARDGSLTAHWIVPDGDGPSQPNASPALLDRIPRALIDDAYHCERHGAVLSLIALSRLSRLRQFTAR